MVKVVPEAAGFRKVRVDVSATVIMLSLTICPGVEAPRAAG